MTPLQLIFIIVASFTLGGALMVVTTKNLIHSALWLILSFFGTAVLFVVLDAGFLGVAQIVIYIGAIAIMMIFVIMLTRGVSSNPESQLNQNWSWALALSIALFSSIVWILSKWSGFMDTAPGIPEGVEPVKDLGISLVSPSAYVLPFEVASILLLASLIGAIVIAWKRKD